LTCLPHELVTPFNLPYLNNKYKDKPEELRNKIFISIFDYQDLYIIQEDYDKYNLKNSSEETFLKKKELSDKFDINHFYDNPELYHSVFKHYLPYVSCIINAIYWKSSYHRILRKSHLTHSICYKEPKLLAIADISCDLKGSIEVLDSYTTFQEPFFVYEPMQDKKVSNPDNATTEGIIYHANPKLACCLPLDSSNYFSNLLKNYIPEVMNIKYDTSTRKSSSEVKRCSNEFSESYESKVINDAIVTEHGYIKDKFRAYLTYSDKNNTCESIDENDKNKFFLSLKLRGHIFDNHVFKKIIDECCFYNVITQMGFTKIGDNNDEISCLYITYYSNKKDNIIKFDHLIDASLKKFKIDKWVVKSNF
jgi:alpha-aminoadipic semialdehyde synthase